MRVRKGMSIDQVREVWIEQSEKKEADIWGKYHAQRPSSGGREGLGIHGIYKQRVTQAKVRIAQRLLKSAGLEVSVSSIHKVTKQSRTTIANYWTPPAEPEKVKDVSIEVEDDTPPPPTYKFPRR